MRMYCAPPTKIDSILRCLETLCDFASVSRTLHTTAFLLWIYSLSHLFIHSTRSRSLYHCRKCLIQQAERLLLLVPLFSRGWIKFITTRVSITRKPYVHYTNYTHIYVYESYLANLYTHGKAFLFRASSHTHSGQSTMLLLQSASQVSFIREERELWTVIRRLWRWMVATTMTTTMSQWPVGHWRLSCTVWYMTILCAKYAFIS